MEEQRVLEYISNSLKAGLELRKNFIQSPADLRVIASIAQELIRALERGHKILLCGNGGSAADSQHIAAELVGRFESAKRHALSAVALTVNTSNITAISNDFGYENVFARQVSALGCKGDVLVCLSTSGNSANIVAALQTALAMNMRTVALLGGDGGVCKEHADISIIVASESSARIQEMHITIGHMLCGIIDQHFAAHE